MSRRALVPLLLLLAAGVFLLAAGLWGRARLEARGEAAAVYDLPAGQGFTRTAEELERLGVVADGWVLRLLARWHGVDRRIPAGRYRFASGLPAAEVLELLVAGQVARVRRTVPEGLEIEGVAARLFPVDREVTSGAQGGGDAAESQRAAAARELAELERFIGLARDPGPVGLPVPPSGTLEGYLFPDTYLLDDPPRAEPALRAMLDNLAAQTDSLRPLAAAQGFSWHQVLTLASIVEGEARVAAERPRIAGVYLNRLRKGMLLQADPTVAYVLHKVGEPLTREDLEVDSPYNTYRYPGLPPGPINNPGLAAIRAVLRAEQHEWLYFVHAGDGSHIFSRTLREHRAAVRATRAARVRARREQRARRAVESPRVQ
jgi:UPF0755 protein